MKRYHIILMFATVLISGCGIFKNSLENAVSVTFLFIIPDSCEVFLIEEIRSYRIDSLKFPENNDVIYLKDNLNMDCQTRLDSISLYSYKNDSIDFKVKVIFNDSNLNIRTIDKGYRMIFAHDTLKEMKLLHGNPDNDSKLYEKK